MLEIQAVDPIHIRPRSQVPVDVNCDLNRAMALLVFDVWHRSTTLDEQTSKRVTKIMKPDTSQSGVFNRGQKIPLKIYAGNQAILDAIDDWFEELDLLEEEVDVLG